MDTKHLPRELESSNQEKRCSCNGKCLANRSRIPIKKMYNGGAKHRPKLFWILILGNTRRVYNLRVECVLRSSCLEMEPEEQNEQNIQGKVHQVPLPGSLSLRPPLSPSPCLRLLLKASFRRADLGQASQKLQYSHVQTNQVVFLDAANQLRADHMDRRWLLCRGCHKWLLTNQRNRTCFREAFSRMKPSKTIAL